MKILLVAINSKYIHSNLAVYSLQAYAREYCDEIQIAEYTINQQIDDILMDLYKKKPDVLCFSCYIWNLNYVEELSQEFHNICPEIPIWVGGPEVSYDAIEVLQRLGQVTGIMKGEGEATFLDVVRYYKKSDIELSDIKGIAYRDCEQQICENSWRDPIDLNDIPFVYKDMESFRNKIVYYESSRGCPFSCSYCLSSIDKYLRFRDLETVKRELQFFIDHEVKQVKFVDRTFNCKHEHAMAIWNYIKEQDKGKTNFHFEIAADLLRDEEIQLIAQMRPGLIQLEIGVQSTYEPTIREIKRTMQFDKVKEIVKQVQSNGNVHQHLDLIAGLPYENLENFKRSFDDVYGLHPEQLQLGFLKVLKGSYMQQQREAYGLIYKSKPPYEVRATKWLSFEEVLELKSVEEMVEEYYNSGQFRHILGKLEEEYASAYEFYKKLATYYEQHDLHMMQHSRLTRYKILMDFVNEFHKEKEALYRDLLILDFYLRENAKSRPEFFGENRMAKEEIADFYERESKQPRYLEGYESYDKQQLRKMTHMEKFSFDILNDCKEGEVRMLFDYKKRNPLTKEATVFVL